MPGRAHAAERADLVLATASAALLFAVVPLALGAFALLASNPAPTAVVLAVGGASLIAAAALGLAARRRPLGLIGLFAADLGAVALIAVLVAFGGRYDSPYVDLFLVAAAHAAAFQPRMRAIAVILGALLAYLVPSAAISGTSATNVARAVIPVLTLVLAGGVIQAAAERVRRQRDAWADREAMARELADQDPLTGLGNYRRFWRAIEREAARVRRYGGPFSLVLLDLDRFKAVNDDLGHRAGDALLERLARALSGALRREDVICRHGGDEFAVVAVQAGAEEAAQLADRLVDAVADAGVVERHRVTATAGWATFGVHAESVEDLVLQADDAMRTAKRSGRRSSLARAVGEARRDPVAGEAPSRGRSGGAQSDQLALLGSLARALAAARDERTAVDTAVAHLAGAVDAEIVTAERLDRDAGRLEIAAFAGQRGLAPPRTQPSDAGILGAVLAAGQPAVVGDVRADSRYIGFSQLADVRSELAVPIFERGRPWGVLNLESSRVDAYTDDDLRLVQAVSVQLGRALACVWAFSQMDHEGPIVHAYELAAAVQEEGDECWRVADLAWRLGRELGLEGDDLESLYLAALFHDVGTVGVPVGLPLKPGRLTEQELALVREHPVIGERMLRPLPRLHAAASVVRHEHERFDGRGYPDGLSRGEIPLTARALLACDAYVAMTSARAYRPAMGYAEALGELRRAAGSQLDPDVVAVLLRLLEPSDGDPAPAAEPASEA
ncbi:MAG TPA: diguanylate cyclase [Solirubrobacteraceae bacterium]|nr:diguanylate cyclase [Solirubrobacteraceae bacterium]